MAEIKWKSEEEKFEAIGYLSVPGVISSIEATVPIGKKEDFRKEYEGKFSQEYPYEANKYGKQFRIYLNDTDGCPDFLRNNLDGAYGNRLNNTEFIDELVKEYGFKFTKDAQDSIIIKKHISMKVSPELLQSFQRGFNGYRDFIQDIEKCVKEENNLPNPVLLEYAEKTISRKTGQASGKENKNTSAYTPNQMLKLGWAGEEYISYLLKKKNVELLTRLNISEENFSYEWFNEGVQNAEEEILFTNITVDESHEFVKKWEDKSVGKGCDIIITLDSGKEIYVEVKTSRRSYSFFNMTSIEMQEMENKQGDYFIVKLNNFENLLNNKSPDIIVIDNPYEKIFHPQNMKEATFVIGGK